VVAWRAKHKVEPPAIIGMVLAIVLVVLFAGRW
jgi:hypothetical protein